MRLFYRSRLTVYEVAERFRKRLLSADARSARVMRNAYVEAERAITAELKAIVKRIDAAVASGLPIESAWGLRRLEVEALLRRVTDEINGFAELAAKTASAQQSLFAGLGAEHAQALARAAGVTAGFRRLNESALVDLMGSLERGSPLYDLFRELGPRAASHARAVFAKAAATGANPRATAKALVRDIRGLSSTRALVIARTETMRSYRTATQRSFAANAGVITGWRWMAAHQPRTCAACLAMDGTIHGVDDVMHSHPACVVGETLVTADSVLAATARRYSGELLDIRITSGDVLTVTPNHPILTRNGWIPAGLINQGDDVLYCPRPELPASLINPDNEQGVARIEDVLRSIRSSFGVLRATVPCTPKDFHGDGSNGDVDVVTTNRLLSNGGKSALAQRVTDGQFVMGDAGLQSLSSSGDFLSMLASMFDPGQCSVCGSNILGVLDGITPGHHEPIGFRDGSNCDTRLNETRVDHATTNSEASGDSIGRLSRGVASDNLRDRHINAAGSSLDDFSGDDRVPLLPAPFSDAVKGQTLPESFWADAINGTQLVDAFPGLVGFSKVEHVARREVSGLHVFNLETGLGWYFANGLIVHNCRCAMVPVTEYSRAPRETGAQWFARQSEEVQRQILGPGKYDLYKAGRLTLADMVKETTHPRWGKGRTEATITQALANARESAL